MGKKRIREQKWFLNTIYVAFLSISFWAETIALFIERDLYLLSPEISAQPVMKRLVQEQNKHFPWLIDDWLLPGCFPTVTHHYAFLTTKLYSWHEKGVLICINLAC